MSTLPAGLKDNNIEFYLYNGKLEMLANGTAQSATHLSTEVRKVVLKDMINNKPAVAKIMSWGFSGASLIEKYLTCRCGKFDMIPDIDLEKGVLNSEYWDCPNRAKCEGTGIVCQLPEGPNGKLSHREIDVIKSIAEGEPIKTTCEKIGLKFNTFKAYQKSIYRKLNVRSNVELIRVANSIL